MAEREDYSAIQPCYVLFIIPIYTKGRLPKSPLTHQTMINYQV